MSWHPSQPNGWNPKLSQVGDRILVLYGAGDVHVAELTLDLQPIAERPLASGGAFPMGWIRPGVATWQVDAGNDRMARFEATGPNWHPDLTADARDAVAGNLGVAGAGHWATYLAAPHFRTVIDGREVARPSGGVLTMAWPWVAHASTNDNLFVARYRDGRAVFPDVPTAVPMNFLVVGRQGHLAYGNGVRLHASDPNGVDLGSQLVTPWHYEVPIQIVDIRGTAHLVTRSFDGVDGLFLIRPFGATRAQVVRIWATNGDVLPVGDHLVVAGSGPRGELTVTRIPIDQATEDLPVRMEPLPRGYICYWYDDGKFGTATPARLGIFIGKGMYQDGDGQFPPDWATRLAQAVVSAGAGFVTVDDLEACRSIWDRVHGVWVHEPDAREANALADAARAAVRAQGLEARPILCVVRDDLIDRDDWVLPDAYDWIVPEVYEPTTTDDWVSAQGRMTRRIARILAKTGHKPVLFAGQAYDRRPTLDRPPVGFSEDALEAYQPVYFDAWRANPARVKGVGFFSWWGRPGGVNDQVRPHVTRWHRAAITASPGLPPVERPAGGTVDTNAPKVTIEGVWPVRLDVDRGARARVRAVARVTQGQVDRLEWRIRPVGTAAWAVVARNPASDLDHHFDVGPGEYQIGLDAFGPHGADHTGSDRRIMVVERAIVVPPPDPNPDPVTPGDLPTVRFQTGRGFYLTALNGGGHPGEDFRGLPAGLITASEDGRSLGGWQDMLVRPGAKTGTFGLRSVNGAWWALQDDGRVVALAHRPADYRPDGRQAFRFVKQDGAVFAIQASNGKFLAAIGGGGSDVIADRDTAGIWEFFTATPAFAIPDVEPEPDRVDRAIVGRVRPFGPRGIQDDVGPFLATAVSRFYFMSCMATDPGRAARELDLDARYGYHPRVLAEVGDLDGSGFWSTTGWDMDDSRTEAMIAAICQGARERGIRIPWTALGKSLKTKARDRRLAHVQRVGRVLRDYPDAVLFADVVNEPAAGWSWPGPSETHDLADALDEASGRQFLIGTGAVWTDRGWVNKFDGGATAFSPAGWEKTQRLTGKHDRSMAIAHLDRDQSRSEERDRPWRQSWDVGLEGDRWADLEHVGDGSSVTAESRPAVLRSHRLVAHVARAAVSCLHGSAGVRGLERWEDRMPYHEVWKSRRYLDPDMVNGQQLNANPKFPERPFTLEEDDIRADNGNKRGIVRCYSVQAPNGVLYSVPFGPVDYTYPDRGAGAGTVRLKVERDLTVKAVQQDLGVELWEKRVGAGETIEIDSKHPDVLLISR